MKENGTLLETSEMEEVNKYGQMAVCMKVIGEMIRLMAEEDSFTQMEMFMKESGLTTKYRGKEYINSHLGLFTEESSSIT